MITKFVFALLAMLAVAAEARSEPYPAPQDGDFVLHDFRFGTGETMPELRMHYTTVGQPVRDASGAVGNAVLILHGTTGSGQQFLRPQFADVLFKPGGVLDASRYFVILPDSIGHGQSSKPSDGLRTAFPRYDYDDMVAAEYRLVTEGLGVRHLRLVMGTSMGCMHTFVWGETYPDAMSALMPLACLTVPIAGRNWLWRHMIMDAIRSDPAWQNGNYADEPAQGIRAALDVFLLAGSAPLWMQSALPDAAKVDDYLAGYLAQGLQAHDANNLLYQVDAARNYNASDKLDRIKAPVMWVNSEDDFINPPELGIAEQEVRKLQFARFVLLPISEQTRGHGTHSWPAVWQQYLRELLERTQR